MTFSSHPRGTLPGFRSNKHTEPLQLELKELSVIKMKNLPLIRDSNGKSKSLLILKELTVIDEVLASDSIRVTMKWDPEESVSWEASCQVLHLLCNS